MTTLRILLALSSSRGWQLHQMDVQNAFLHSTLDEEIYMKLPLAPNLHLSLIVFHLQKIIYGLKQASRV